jgi:hypothetical protein
VILRTVFTITYLGTVIVAVALNLFYPSIAVWVLYGLLIWFVASLFLYRLPVMARPIGNLRRPGPNPSVTPLSSNSTVSAGGPSAFLGFCTNCATPVEPGTPVCPSCGRRIPGS